jgi:hypothetical protein
MKSPCYASWLYDDWYYGPVSYRLFYGALEFFLALFDHFQIFRVRETLERQAESQAHLGENILDFVK